MKSPAHSYKTLMLVTAAAAFMWYGNGCTQPTPEVPHNLAEYGQMRLTNPNAYPKKTLQLQNLQRVMDTSLNEGQRLDSLKLLIHLGAEGSDAQRRLSVVLRDKQCPYELRKSVLSYLLERNYPGLAEYVVPALAQTDQSPELRDAILQWLMHNPDPQVLSEVVKLWSQEESPLSANEPRFRHIVERITGRQWDDALIAGINSRQKFARGRAIEILTARVPANALKRQLLRVHPETAAMAALQSFAETLDYLPRTRSEFAAATTVFKSRFRMMSDVARLASQWREDYGYEFSIRDFHLLSRLARDPLRNMLRRTHLVLEISRALAARQHVQATGNAGHSDRFYMQVQNLSISDMWNIFLLNEMLSRPRVQMALRIVSDKLRNDPGQSHHGLILYQQGQAEAMLFPSPNEPAVSRAEPISVEMRRAGRDSLCRFYSHFSDKPGTSEAGPNPDELAEAAREAYYGLTVTNVSDKTFCAHYYNPDGQTISLGTFPLTE